jgi:tetratricopeptide (TPR) repeat protein
MTVRLLRAVALAAALLVWAGFEREASAQGRSGSDSPGQQALSDGLKFLEADDYANAETKFREAISLDPKLNVAYGKLAAILYGKKQYPQAVELLRRAPDQTDLDVQEYLGLSLYKTANPPPAESVRLLEEVVLKRPQSYAAQAQLGQFLLKSEPKRAAAAMEAYLRYRPPAAANMDQEIHMRLGTAYVYAKEWDLAQREFEGLLKTKPNDMTAKLMLGSVLVGKNACSQAISLYERILSEAQRQPSIYYNLGTCYLREKRPADALREAELYIKAKPNDAKGHVLTCDALFDQKNYPRALTECQSAERFDQVNGSIKGKVGRIYLAMKNFQSAVTYLEQAVAGTRAAGQGKDPEILGALAEAYSAVKAPRDKLNAIANELASLKEPKALATAGQVFFLAGNDEGATSALNAALAADPNNAAARRDLVKVLNRRAGASVDKGEVGAAYQLLSDAVKLTPDDLMTNRNLGLVLLMAKKYSEAEAVLLRSLKKVPNDMVVNRMLGRAQLLQHKATAAMATYEKAAQMALRTRGPDLAAIYTELGPMYADGGRLDQAVSVLETAVKEAGQTALLPVAQRNLSIAYFKRATERLRDPKQTDAAYDDMVAAAAKAPRGAMTAKETAAISCGEAIAALKANKIQQAEDAWDQAVKSGGDNACVFRPPYDKLGTKFFVAYTQYRDSGNPAKREGAVKLFTQLAARATGVSAEWLRALLRSGYELLAYDFYQRSDEKRAGQYLSSASKVQAKGDRRELEHNLAVIDLFTGKSPQAEKVFDSLGGRPCEARLNLGILRDRQGESKKALELYKQAKACGARTPKLAEWIDVKERLFGGGAP